MINFSGVAAIGATLLRPGLIVPHLLVSDIRALSWVRAKRQGFDYIVFDKDNCLTSPHSDALEPSLHDSYQQCLKVFGEENVLIVSNSAGSSSDIGAVGAQHLSRALYGTTVLCHAKKKPAKACARQVVDYFSQVHDPSSSTSPSGNLLTLFATRSTAANEGEAVKQLVKKRMGKILIIGDRITTDTVTAHRTGDVLEQRYPSAALPRAVSVITTTLWAKEGWMNTLMRSAETSLMRRLVKRGIRPGGGWKQSTEPLATWDILLHPATSSPRDVIAPSPPSRLIPDPTPSTYLASQIERSSLPEWASNILIILVSNRTTRAVSRFFRDGWHLILRGCREGLNRPNVIFRDQRARLRLQDRSTDTSPSAQSSLWPSRSQRQVKSYSSLVARKGLGSSFSSFAGSQQTRPYSSGPNSKVKTGEIKDENIVAYRVQLVDNDGRLDGPPRSPRAILGEIDRSQYYLLQVTKQHEVPIVRVVSKKEAFDKQKAKRASTAGAGSSAASQPPAEVQLSWLVTDHDLNHKLESGRRHLLKKGPGARVKVLINTKKGRLWTSGKEEDKLNVVRKIEKIMLASGDTGSGSDGGGGGKDKEQAGQDAAPSTPAPEPASAAASAVTAPKLRRRGDVTWQEPNKYGAIIWFEAYK